MTEYAVSYPCQDDTLVGIVHKPDQPKRRGIMMVVAGGPQYRVGGHRQLTLWARRLADEGFPVFRFDNRGVGDSHGQYLGYQHLDEDIAVSVDRFFAEIPDMEEVVLWGECNAASAILLFAYRDKRVKATVLLNPWARTDAGEARTILRFYYLQRIMEPSFWKKVFSFKFNPLESLGSALDLLARVRSEKKSEIQTEQRGGLDAAIPHDLPLPERLLMGFTRFSGQIMLVLSGRDLIAKEFDEMLRGSAEWQAQVAAKPVSRLDLPDADHTFSSAATRGQVADWAVQWLKSW